MFIARLLICASSAVVLVLGIAHLLIMYRGTKLKPRDQLLYEKMQLVPPIVSSETTMWKAWVGFNESHSIGLILFAAIYGFLAVGHFELLFGSVYLSIVGGLVLIRYVMLARKYWFNIPLAGASASLLLYLAAQVVAIAAR